MLCVQYHTHVVFTESAAEHGALIMEGGLILAVLMGSRCFPVIIV